MGSELRDDLNSDGSWDCPVENCSVFYPAGMTYLADDHERLHQIIEQAYIDGYNTGFAQKRGNQTPEKDYEFKEEYDWYGES